jgi:hypothetical protein
MKVIVCGGRNYKDANHVFLSLDAIHAETPVAVVVHGGATGADELAGLWAVSRKVPEQRFPADWNKYGNAAGPIRNREMLKQQPDLVVAFPGGRWTADMVRIALRANVRVVKP